MYIKIESSSGSKDFANQLKVYILFNIFIFVICKKKKKKLAFKKFQYSSDIITFVNKSNYEVVSITSNGKFEGEGYTLFYYNDNILDSETRNRIEQHFEEWCGKSLSNAPSEKIYDYINCLYGKDHENVLIREWLFSFT